MDVLLDGASAGLIVIGAYELWSFQTERDGLRMVYTAAIILGLLAVLSVSAVLLAET